MRRPALNSLFWCLVLFFTGIVSAVVAFGPNPGPQPLQVVEIDMEAGPRPSTRNIPRPRRRNTTLRPEETRPVQAAAVPPVPETVKQPAPQIDPVAPTARLPKLDAPAVDSSLSGISTTAAAAAAGLMTKKDFLQLLKMRIEALKRYPHRARKRNQQGRVVIEFRLEKKGQVTDVRVRKSSGSTLLDRAAVQAVEKAAPFPQAPKGLFAYPVRLRIGVVFQLT